MGQPLMPVCITDCSNLYLDPFKLRVSQMNNSLPCHHDNRKTPPKKTSEQIPLVPFCSVQDATAQTHQTMSLFVAWASSKPLCLSQRCAYLMVSGESANPISRIHCMATRPAAIAHGNSRDPLHGCRFCYSPVQ